MNPILDSTSRLTNRSRLRRKFSTVAACLGLLVLTERGHTQDQARAQDAESKQDLTQRVEQLEHKNEVLEKRVKELEGGAEVGEADQGSGFQFPDDEFAVEGLDEMNIGLSAEYGDVTANFQIFGDTRVEYHNPEPEDHSNAYFAAGGLDVFTTVRVGDNFHFLSETVIELHDDDTEISQERLWGSWSMDDELGIKFGLEHNPISLWNNNYHHGQWLQPTIYRPLIAEFEGEGGILPLHNTGIEVFGSTDQECGRFRYHAILSNGRGRTPRDKQRTGDGNEAKALDLGAAWRPSCCDNLEVGVAVRTDTIPKDSGSADPARAHGIENLIGSAFVTYDHGPVDWSAEAVWIRDDVRVTGSRFIHYGGYLQALWQRDGIQPYTRFDVKRMESGDPFYAPLDRDTDHWRQVLGVRYDANSNVALKLEGGVGRRQHRNGVGRLGDRTETMAALEFSWVF